MRKRTTLSSAFNQRCSQLIEETSYGAFAMYGIDWKDSIKEIADVRLFGGKTNTKGAKINSPNIL